MTTKKEKQRSEAQKLLAVAERHKQSAFECSAGHRPLSNKDPLSRVLITKDGSMCPECAAKLEAVGMVENEDFAVMIPPRGLSDEQTA